MTDAARPAPPADPTAAAPPGRPPGAAAPQPPRRAPPHDPQPAAPHDPQPASLHDPQRARPHAPQPAAPRATLRDPIALRLLGALAGLVALFAAMGGLAFWGARETAREIAAFERGLNQLEVARATEAAFGRYLLREIGRRLEGDDAAGESPEAGVVRGLVLTYRRVTEGVFVAAAADRREAARPPLLRARRMQALFDAVETEAMLDRRLRGSAAGRAGEAGAREFLSRIAGERDGAFRSILSEVVAEERAAAEAAYARLEALRAGLAWRGGALAAAFLLAAVAAGVVFHRSLMRPIRALVAAAAAFGGGARAARAPTGLPGGFGALADTFNAMAGRIAGEQARLEAEVAARTADLAAANAELTRIDDTRRRFFANVSHELRTPVTVLLGEAQVAQRARDPEAWREALARIAASGGYLRRRLDDLMNLARSEDGALRLTMGRADLNAVAAGAVDVARAYAAAHEIALDFHPAEEPATAAGDAEALRQAALALIDNAVKFSAPGGAVEARVGRTPDGLTLSVADRGPGFAGDDAAALFGRYAQAEGGRRAGGAGLGLAIVRWIAEQHGGDVRAANRPGGGAEITLTLREAP